MSPDVSTPLLIVVPLVAGLLGLLLPQGARRPAALLGVGGAAVALAAALALLPNALPSDRPGALAWRWAQFGGLTVDIALRPSLTAAYVALAVTVVALAVQVYSVAYLHDDDRYAPYAAQVSLFTAAMLIVVFADDLILLLVGWEVMGLCSYLLIGHDRRLPEAPGSAVKAFLVTRAGDVGFLLGIAVLGVSAGSFRVGEVLAADHGPVLLTTGLLLLLCGVAGKSAQFPLHTWLPDAMAGPTPVSALIHAATMVAAGVYVVARLHPLFAESPATLAVLAVVAAVTILLGALAATAQDDIKRVLAWSTVSQIGYMTAALAAGSTSAALFHLLTHAAFKALLFLAAGAVIHAVGTNLMSAMGGLRTAMPATFTAMVVGLGALAGLPPLAGFWSKDTVLVAAAAARDGHGPGPAWAGLVVWLAALLGVAITAWYATRLLLRTFFGARRTGEPYAPPPFPGAAPPHEPAAHGEPHDPPALMRWPVGLLTIAAAVVGLLAFVPAFTAELGLVEAHLDVNGVLALGLLALGAAAAWWRWRAAPAADPAAALGRLRPLFAGAFRIDDAQDLLVVRPAHALARFARRADERVVDGAVEATGAGATRLGVLLGRAHAAAVPRAVAAALAGALLVAVVAAVVGGVA
ncbi:NADH-quinone oxidoreductase subunit 5 family protein [Spirilliplanes yamanashiensis]|uniref:NADH dehydrogenase n=1 Tax=Spirilliplanes yamanashiensis TaxID=42233 RepID=A0A8J3Y8W3_9ACTN|nr:NADH-quinone oxidoreductase subunit L [Spirilliplanes yamanashiensis]MDP9815813.1 NADH-quinone oxidoreductase subunit L [Spirilliplanes yamanashiensis]GIJ04068.1 NADH dehydrogenase [Spirilliplanes yamanashiensis]